MPRYGSCLKGCNKERFNVRVAFHDKWSVSRRHSQARGHKFFQLTDRGESTGSADGGGKGKDDGRGKLHGDGLVVATKDVREIDGWNGFPVASSKADANTYALQIVVGKTLHQAF